MTEKDLRQQFVAAAESFLGYNEADKSHRKIIDIYNAHKPLAQGYKVSYVDEWCATFVSVAAIQSGLTAIMPTECSCGRMIELHKELGSWQENEAITPEVGDLIMYDWGDNGVGDSVGWPEHVGIVCEIGAGWLKIIEGNLSNSVKYRWIADNGKFIRGYCKPDFASAAAGAKPVQIPETKPAEPTIKTEEQEARYTMNMRLLKKGSKGEDVRALQILLIGRGYSCGIHGADGDFGSDTDKAVRAYQKDHKLTVDGEVGPDTMGSLLGG